METRPGAGELALIPRSGGGSFNSPHHLGVPSLPPLKAFPTAAGGSPSVGGREQE
jgi:hypothetical protein